MTSHGVILITRPEPGASETAKRLAVMGFLPLLAPMMVVHQRSMVSTGTPQAVLVTSSNAVGALPATLHSTLLLAVGDATASRAREAGFTRVESASRDAAALAVLVAGRCRRADGALLLAVGAGQGLDLSAELRRQGFTVRRRVAYNAAPAKTMPTQAAASLAAGEVKVAMFFSPATARAFVACLGNRTALVAEVVALAISAPTAQALNPLPFRAVRVALEPNQDQLMALLT